MTASGELLTVALPETQENIDEMIGNCFSDQDFYNKVSTIKRKTINQAVEFIRKKGYTSIMKAQKDGKMRLADPIKR